MGLRSCRSIVDTSCAVELEGPVPHEQQVAALRRGQKRAEERSHGVADRAPDGLRDEGAARRELQPPAARLRGAVLGDDNVALADEALDQVPVRRLGQRAGRHLCHARCRHRGSRSGKCADSLDGTLSTTRRSNSFR